MVQWVEPGQAIELRAGPLVLTVREIPDGTVALTVEPVGEFALVEPAVVLAPRGTFTINLAAVLEPVMAGV